MGNRQSLRSWKRGLADYLDILANDAKKLVGSGYYEAAIEVTKPALSLKQSILGFRKAPIISEVKFTSPSEGELRKNRDVESVARDMEEGGAVGISVLTEPNHFKGQIRFVAEIRKQVNVPILMKDLILSPLQIDAASKSGANAVLLIQTLFERSYCEKDVQEMIAYSHSKSLEVLLEVHTEKEFLSALKTEADMIGVNNRDLKTLKVDLEVTKRILSKHRSSEKVFVTESGINSSEDVRLLRSYGAQAFLVGTAIMKAGNVKEKVKELVESL